MKKQLRASQYTLKDRDIKKLIDSAGDLRDRIIIKLMAFAGLRRAETAQAHVTDIDWKLSRLNVIGKGNKQRTVILPRDLLQDLKFYIGNRPHGPLFPSKRIDSGKMRLGEYQINEIVKAAGKAAKLKNPNPDLKNINPHSLRHYFAWKLKSAGVRIETISALMGHSDIKTTLSQYGNQSLEDMQVELDGVWEN